TAKKRHWSSVRSSTTRISGSTRSRSSARCGLNFQATRERIARLEEENGFKNLATSNKKSEKIRLQEIEAGKKRQEEIRALLRDFGKTSSEKLYKDRKRFIAELKEIDQQLGMHLSAAELKVVLNTLSERDETAEICRDRDGNPEPDSELRD